MLFMTLSERFGFMLLFKIMTLRLLLVTLQNTEGRIRSSDN